MVSFDKGKHAFKITVTGDKDNYCSSLKALARAIATMDEQVIDKQTIYHLGTLLEEMLPGAEQINDTVKH